MKATRLTLAFTLALAILAGPPAAEGQQAGRTLRIGYMFAGSKAGTTETTDAFLHGLRDHGYVEGQNVVVEWRFAEGRVERLAEFAAELLRLKVDVIVTIGAGAARAAQKATSTVPIVFWAVNDPLGAGLVESLARPGKNITGLTNVNVELSRKRLELLTELVPRAKKIAVLNAPGGGTDPQVQELRDAARLRGVELQVAETRDADQFRPIFAKLSKAGAGAVFVVPHHLFYGHRADLADLAVRHRVPMMGWVREWAEAGAVMSYGASNVDMQRRMAGYVAKILQGAKSADLPVEQPTKFELVINLKTAKALGLTIPQSILLRADQVIE